MIRSIVDMRNDYFALRSSKSTSKFSKQFLHHATIAFPQYTCNSFYILLSTKIHSRNAPLVCKAFNFDAELPDRIRRPVWRLCAIVSARFSQCQVWSHLTRCLALRRAQLTACDCFSCCS